MGEQEKNELEKSIDAIEEDDAKETLNPVKSSEPMEPVEPQEPTEEDFSEEIEEIEETETTEEEFTLITDDNRATLLNSLMSSWFPDFTYPRKVYGVQLSKLRILYSLNDEIEEQFFKELALTVEPLGLQLKMYEYNDETWICLRSFLGGPTGLTEEEEGVLGVIIYMVKKDPIQSIRYSNLEEFLTQKKYIKKTHLRYIIQSLERNGYISRARGRITLFYRLEIEFSEESLDEIIAEVEKLLV